MNRPIVWRHALRAAAKLSGQSLVAYGYEGPNGRRQAIGACGDREARALYALAERIHRGVPLAEACAEVLAEVEAADRAQAERDRPTLGKRARARREELGIGLRTLSKRTGLCNGFLSEVERDKTGIREGSLKRIAEGLMVPVEYLTGEGS